VGIIVLPLMIFHQVQLMVCSFIAGRYKKTNEKQQQAVQVKDSVMESQK
jgi:sodium/bile acid cotransporter 7